MGRYYARSAANDTDDWPVWFVADEQKGGLNVTADVARSLNLGFKPGAVFMPPWEAVKLAMLANRRLPQ